MIGDVLRRKIHLFRNATARKTGDNQFWIILRDIAVEEIIEYGGPVDSDIIIPIYYNIFLDNLDNVPDYFLVTLKSNNQERFRVIIRNLFSSNSFHTDGLANQEGIYAYKSINEFKKGKRVVFQKKEGGEHVN